MATNVPLYNVHGSTPAHPISRGQQWAWIPRYTVDRSVGVDHRCPPNAHDIPWTSGHVGGRGPKCPPNAHAHRGRVEMTKSTWAVVYMLDFTGRAQNMVFSDSEHFLV